MVVMRSLPLVSLVFFLVVVMTGMSLGCALGKSLGCSLGKSLVDAMVQSVLNLAIFEGFATITTAKDVLLVVRVFAL